MSLKLFKKVGTYDIYNSHTDVPFTWGSLRLAPNIQFSTQHILQKIVIIYRGTYLRTTTIGLSLPVTTIRPFQIIKADDTIIPKLST